MTTNALVEKAEEMREYVDAMLNSPQWPENPLARRPFKIKDQSHSTRQAELYRRYRIVFKVGIEEDGTKLILKDGEDQIKATFETIKIGMDFLCTRIEDSLRSYEALLAALGRWDEFFSLENAFFEMLFVFAWEHLSIPATLGFKIIKKTYGAEPARIVFLYCGSLTGEVHYRVDVDPDKNISFEEALAYMQS